MDVKKFPYKGNSVGFFFQRMNRLSPPDRSFTGIFENQTLTPNSSTAA